MSHWRRGPTCQSRLPPHGDAGFAFQSGHRSNRPPQSPLSLLRATPALYKAGCRKPPLPFCLPVDVVVLGNVVTVSTTLAARHLKSRVALGLPLPPLLP
jgi:hypothetical protein